MRAEFLYIVGHRSGSAFEVIQLGEDRRPFWQITKIRPTASFTPNQHQQDRDPHRQVGDVLCGPIEDLVEFAAERF